MRKTKPAVLLSLLVLSAVLTQCRFEVTETSFESAMHRSVAFGFAERVVSAATLADEFFPGCVLVILYV